MAANGFYAVSYSLITAVHELSDTIQTLSNNS